MTHGTGDRFHPLSDDPNTPADMLSNSFLPLAPIASKLGFQGPVPVVGPVLRIPQDPHDRPCMNCGGLTGLLDRAQQVIVLPRGVGADLGMMQPDGSIAVLDNATRPGLAASLRSDLTWANAVESNPLAGRGAASPVALGFSSDGTTVMEQAFLRGGQALGVVDMMVEQEVRDAEHPTAIAHAEPNSVSSSVDSALEPRSGFQTVYSRAAGKLFVLGGESLATGEPTRDIWWRDVEVGSWMRIPLQGWQPEKVLAATRSPLDGRLWVLDEKNFGSYQSAQLVLVDPSNGVVETIGTWPRIGLFDRHWFVLDNDGSVLFVASSAVLRKHAIVRLSVDRGTPRVSLVRFGKGELAMSPWVDLNGYSFPVVVNQNQMPEIVRLDELEGRVGQWTDVAGCL